MSFGIDEHMSGCWSSFERSVALRKVDATKELLMGSNTPVFEQRLARAAMFFGTVRMVVHLHLASMSLECLGVRP
jgi:hypothetical protein